MEWSKKGVTEEPLKEHEVEPDNLESKTPETVGHPAAKRTKTIRPTLKRLMAIVETRHKAEYEKDGLFFDFLSSEVNDILGLHRKAKTPYLASAESGRPAEGGILMQGVPLDSNSLKWTNVGEGSTCTVWQVSLQSGQFIGIKRRKVEGRLLQQYIELKHEAMTLLSLRHTNLMSYFGIGYDTHSACVCVEFIQGETLLSIINRFGPLSDEKSSHYTRQIVQGLEYLHSKNIAHRTVKAAKVMVTPKDVAKLIDLWSLKIELSTGVVSNIKPFVHWMAPERIDPMQVGPNNKKSDIWSLGCTVHEMATSYPPWANSGFKSTFELLNNIVQGNPIPPLPDTVSTEITSFIFRCLVHDQRERPGASELLEDAFLAVKSKPITDERAQEIIDQAMESGSLQQRNVVGLITGLMGSGKTTLLHYLFGLAPPGLYTSTGVAEQSFRGLLHHILRISAGVWRRLSYKDIREVLALLMQAGMKKTDINFLAACLMRDIEPVEEPLDSSSTITAPTSSSTNPTLSVPTASLPQVEKSPSCQEMVPLVKSTAPSHPTEELLLLELVHMIDTGGQPELMEVMPSLIHNANLALVLVNLKYGLNEHPPVDCHQNGIPYKREVPSHYTGREVILKLVSTLHARKNLNESFHLIIVATHRDCVESGLGVQVDSLNKELHGLLLPAFEDELILFEAPDKIAFVLNLKNPDDEDKKAMELIRTEVGKPALGRTFDTPSSFFVFEQDLLQFAESVAKRDILSLSECRQVGARLKMSDEVVEAALVLFHHQNTFLYFRHVLPNHVFVKPQVPLDIVNGIVRSSYLPLQGVPAKLVSLLKKAVITEELLSNDKIISPHFKKGLYEVQDAIKLFCHTFIIAPLQPDATEEGTDSVDDRKKEYLMMCLKPAIPDQELHCYIPKSSDTVPLVVKFSSGCVPMGCFGSTVSCLLSKYDWQVIRRDKCLAHNIACFHDPDLLVNIVLVDFIKRLEVHIDSNLSIHESPSNICSQICSQVLGAIEKVFHIMHIERDQITTSPAVFCNCLDSSEKHLADFVNRKGKHFLCCELFKTTSKPNEKQLLWMGIDATQKNLSQPAVPPSVSNPPAPLQMAQQGLSHHFQPQFQGHPQHPQFQDHPQYHLSQSYTPYQHQPPNQTQLMWPVQLPQGPSQYQHHQPPSHTLVDQQPSIQLTQSFQNQSIMQQATQGQSSTQLGELGCVEGFNIAAHGREFTDYAHQSSQSSPSLLDTPTLPLLQHFPTQSGNINILEGIAVRSHSLGIRLLKDDTGAITSNIEVRYRPDQTRISEAILQRWLEGTGRKPQSWATLVTVLQEIGLSVLAKEIDKNLLHT